MYIGVMLSIARSRYTSVAHFVVLVLNAFGLLVGTIYNANTPDLYENNAHHKVGWISTWIVTAQALVGLVLQHTRAAAPTKSFLGVQYNRFKESDFANRYRWSQDSGQGTEPGSPETHPTSPAEPEREAQRESYESEPEDHEEKLGLLSNSAMDRYFMRKFKSITTSRFVSFASVPYNVMDRLILFLSFIALATGLVTYGGHFVSWSRLWAESRKSLTQTLEGHSGPQRACSLYQRRNFLLVWIADFGARHG